MGSGLAQNFKKSKGRPRRKNSELRKKSTRKKKAQRKIKTTDHVNCPLGDSFIPSMKSQNGIFWMVDWWVLGHSSHMCRNDGISMDDNWMRTG